MVIVRLIATHKEVNTGEIGVEETISASLVWRECFINFVQHLQLLHPQLQRDISVSITNSS